MANFKVSVGSFKSETDSGSATVIEFNPKMKIPPARIILNEETSVFPKCEFDVYKLYAGNSKYINISDTIGSITNGVPASTPCSQANDNNASSDW